MALPALQNDHDGLMTLVYDGDNMAPTIRPQEFVVYRRIDHFDHDGLYLLDCGTIRRCARQGDWIFLSSDNKVYRGYAVLEAHFSGRVRGKVTHVVTCCDKSWDRHRAAVA